MKSIKKIKMDALCHRPISDADALAFVKQSLSPYPVDWERNLIVDLQHAHQGRVSVVLFALNGSPMRGHAFLYPYNGRLAFADHMLESQVLRIQRHTGTNPRRTRDRATIEIFLQVARSRADIVGAFREVDLSKN